MIRYLLYATLAMILWQLPDLFVAYRIGKEEQRYVTRESSLALAQGLSFNSKLRHGAKLTIIGLDDVDEELENLQAERKKAWERLERMEVERNHRARIEEMKQAVREVMEEKPIGFSTGSYRTNYGCNTCNCVGSFCSCTAMFCGPFPAVDASDGRVVRP